MNREEEIQRRIEDGQFTFTPEDEDGTAYSQVFKVLEQPPAYSLPPDFADRVVALAEAKQDRSNGLDHMWLVAGLVAIITGTVAGILYAGVKIELKLEWGFLSGLLQYRGVLLFGALFIGLLHLIDKLLLRRGMHSEDIKKAIPFL